MARVITTRGTGKGLVDIGAKRLQALDTAGVDNAEYLPAADENSAIQKMQTEHARTVFDTSFRSTVSSEPLKKDPFYIQQIKDKVDPKEAYMATSKKRSDAWAEHQKTMDYFDARLRDIENKKSFGILKSVLNSAAMGVEQTIAIGRVMGQGTDIAAAYQEASQNIAYHDPDGTMDKYLNLAAANAAPMGTTIGLATVPGVGTALSSAFMGTQMGTDVYLDLIRKGVAKEDAISTGVVAGIALGGIEAATGKVLTETLGKVPLIGKGVGSGSRADRLKALRSIKGAKGDYSKLYKTISGKGVDMRVINQALREVFGSDTTRAGVIATIAKQGSTEALTGGVEEWLQEGVQLALTDDVLESSGLEGVLPRLEDGSLDTSELTDTMNEAFVAGALLEGLIGGGVALSSLKSRMNTADAVGAISRGLKGQVVTTKTGNAVNMDHFSNESRDFIARHALMASIVSEKKNKTFDNGVPLVGKVDELTVEQRQKIMNDSISDSIDFLVNNPIGAMHIDYGDSEIESIADGKIAVVKVGGERVAVVKSEGLPNNAAAQFTPNAQGGAEIGISEELWTELEENGLNKDLIAVNLYQGSTLAHEMLHRVIRKLPEDQQGEVLDLWGTEGTEVEQQERAADQAETQISKQRQAPIGSAFKDAAARIMVNTRGRKAPTWAKKHDITRQAIEVPTTGKAPRIQYIGTKTTTPKSSDIVNFSLTPKDGDGAETKTKQFKNWFKDSIVLDSDGNPLVVYHGSGKPIPSEFSSNGIRNRNPESGIYFTGNTQLAAMYAKDTAFNMASNRYSPGSSVGAFYLSLQNPRTIVYETARNAEAEPLSLDLIAQLKSEGYDGVIRHIGDEIEYIAFNSSQVKSAIGNKGTFDSSGDPLSQQKITEEQSGEAFTRYQKIREGLANISNDHIARYSVARNLSPEETEELTRWAYGNITSMLETNKPLAEKSIRAKHPDLYNTIIKATGQMRGFAKAHADYRPVKSASQRQHVSEMLTELSRINIEEGSKAEWTPDMQEKYDAIVKAAEKMSANPGALLRPTDETIAIKEQLDSTEFDELYDIVTSGLIKQNAGVTQDVTRRGQEARSDTVEDVNLGVGRYEIGRSEARPETTSTSTGQFVNPNVPMNQQGRRRAIPKEKNVDLMFPLEPDAYSEIFRDLLFALDSDVTASSIPETANTNIANPGNFSFDIRNNKDIGIINQLNTLYGPMWPIILEVNKLTGEMGDMASDISDVIGILQESKIKAPPNVLRAVSAFITVASQTNSDVPVKILNTGVMTPQDVRIVTDDVVSWFKDIAGLPSDGSPVDLASLGGQYGKTSAEKQEMVAAFEADIQRSASALGVGAGEISDTLETGLSAEQAACDFFRQFTEVYNPMLTQSDLSSQTYQTADAGKKGAGANISNTRIAGIGLNRKATGGPLSTFLTMDVRDTIGQLLNDITARYDVLREKSASTDVSDQGVMAGLGATPEAVESISSKLYGIYTGRTGISAELKDINKQIQVLRKIDQQLTTEEKSTADSVIQILESIVQQVESIPESQRGNLAQAKLNPDAESAMAIDMLRFQDTIHSLRDIKLVKIQSESLTLKEAWDKIFDQETTYRLRDIIKDVAVTLSSKNKMELKTLSEQYNAAMPFALDMMNDMDPQARGERIVESLNKKIEALEDIDKLTVEQNYRLGLYRQYLGLQDMALEIATGQGEYGAKINEFIENTYKPRTDEYWTELGFEESKTAQKVSYYSPRVYVQDNMDGAVAESQFTTTTGREAERAFEDLSVAIDEGEILAYSDFIVSLTAAMSQKINSDANKSIITDSLNSGLFKTKPAAGYSVINAPGATAEGQTIYAPEEIATYFNKLTKTSALRNNPYTMTLLATNAKLKALKIVWGVFHRRSFVWSAMMAGSVTPGMEFFGGDSENSIAAKLKDRFNYGAKRKLGMDLMMQGSREFNSLVYYGMTVFKQQDIGRGSQQYKTKLEKYLLGSDRHGAIKLSSDMLNKLSSLTNRMQDELFGIFGSTLKTATAYNEIMNLTAKHAEQITKEKEESRKTGKLMPTFEAYSKLHPDKVSGEIEFTDYYSATEEEIYRSVAGMANADFGGLHTGRMGVSKTSQDAMRLLFLGPDWTASNIISATKLIRSKRGNTKGKVSGVGDAFSKSKIEQEVYKHFWLRIMARSAALMTVINMLMAGLDDENALERFAKAKKRGKFKTMMTDISPMIHMLGGDKQTDYYFNQTGHFLDIAKIAADPFRMAYHKSSSVLKPAADLVSGTRFDMKRPSRITKIGKQGLYTWSSGKRGPLAPSELPAYGIYQTIQVMPIQMKNALEVFTGEKNVIAGTLEAGLGLDIKQTY